MDPRDIVSGGADDTLMRVVARGNGAPFEHKAGEETFLTQAPVPRDALWKALETEDAPRPAFAVFKSIWARVSRAVWERRSGWSHRMNTSLSESGTFAWNLRLTRQFPKRGEDDDRDLDDRLTPAQMRRMIAVYRRTLRALHDDTPEQLRPFLFSPETQLLMQDSSKHEHEILREDIPSVQLLRGELCVVGITLVEKEARQAGMLKILAPFAKGDVEKGRLFEPFPEAKSGVSEGIDADIGSFPQHMNLLRQYMVENTPWIMVQRGTLSVGVV